MGRSVYLRTQFHKKPGSKIVTCDFAVSQKMLAFPANFYGLKANNGNTKTE